MSLKKRSLKQVLTSIVELDSIGFEALSEKYKIEGPRLSASLIGDWRENVATKVANYNEAHYINPTSYDSGKLVAFLAAEARAQNKHYNSFPFFFAFLGALDLEYSGTGVSLREFGDIVVLSHKLQKFIDEGQWLAAFAFFHGIDLAYYKWVEKIDVCPPREDGKCLHFMPRKRKMPVE